MDERKRVLLVDDNVAFAATLKHNLEYLTRYEVRTVSDSSRALSIARAFRPHCILLDVAMPVSDGGDVAAQFRRDPDLRSVPIAFLTGMLSAKEARKSNPEHPETMFFAKPINTGELIEFIDSVTSASSR